MMTSFIFGNMLQHMQYTVDKCVYFLYSALLKPQNSNNNNNQLPPCLPSQRLPESASALTTQLLSRRWLWSVLALWCMQLSARVCRRRCGGAIPSTQQARTMHTPRRREDASERGARCTSHSTHNHADSLVPFHPTLTPEHRTTSATTTTTTTTHPTASPPRGQSGN